MEGTCRWCLAAWCAVWSFSADPAYCSLQLADCLINCCQIGHTRQKRQRHDTVVWSVISQEYRLKEHVSGSRADPVCTAALWVTAGYWGFLSWDHLSPSHHFSLIRPWSCCYDNHSQIGPQLWKISDFFSATGALILLIKSAQFVPPNKCAEKTEGLPKISASFMYIYCRPRMVPQMLFNKLVLFTIPF